MAPAATGQEYTVSNEFQVIDSLPGRDQGRSRLRLRRTLREHPARDLGGASGRGAEHGAPGREGLTIFEHCTNGVMVRDGFLHSD
jgi:hypothetical protein